jgi:hypothetical protein
MKTEIKTAEQYIDELDRLVDLPETEKQPDRYLDTILAFYLNHPAAATVFLRPILPKIKSLSNADVRVLGKMSAKAFPDATFPYLTFSENGRVPAEAIRAWLTAVVYPAVALEGLIQRNRKIVMAAIWDVLRDSRDLAADLSAEAASLAWDTWTWASQNLKSLLAEETAKSSTRLYGYAWYRACTFKAERLRAKARFVDINIDGLSREADGTLLIEPTTSADSGGAVPVAKLFRKKREKQIETPSLGKMLCVSCQTVNPVLSEDQSGNVTLSCQHSRAKTI